jgi:DNA-directed RNA polymerase subunit M/transcription elongation factor TFIIS
MSLESVKCPHCGYVYRTDVERVVKDGETVAAVRGLGNKASSKQAKEKSIDLTCPSCKKEFEWPIS